MSRDEGMHRCGCLPARSAGFTRIVTRRSAVGNLQHENVILGKAGRSRHRGIRPINRGVSRNPVDHPNGGGAGKSRAAAAAAAHLALGPARKATGRGTNENFQPLYRRPPGGRPMNRSKELKGKSDLKPMKPDTTTGYWVLRYGCCDHHPITPSPHRPSLRLILWDARSRKVRSLTII